MTTFTTNTSSAAPVRPAAGLAKMVWRRLQEAAASSRRVGADPMQEIDKAARRAAARRAVDNLMR